ncbi:glycosyltransferase [Dyadobacter sp. 22481]|uniref:glycosyltransferase n=1 Tax=Dyadobacter sp. 22481 TaxID=3453926 RepID=UPI003F86C2E6
MKKILFANMPYEGHFNPLTGIAMHLKSLGHDVRWYSGSIFKEKIDSLGIPYYPFRKALDFNQHNVHILFPERDKIRGAVGKLKYDLKTAFILRSTEFYEDIREIDESWSFDLLISDIAFTGMPFVKEKLRKKVISVGVFPLIETSRDLPPTGLAMTPSNNFFGRRKQDFLRFFANKVIFREAAGLFARLFREHGMVPVSGNIFDVLCKKTDLLLQSGTPGFEYSRSDLSKKVRFVGPLLPFTKGGKGRTDLGEQLGKYEKVILVTQGTMEKDPEKILVPTLDAFKNTPVLVIATTGGMGTSELQARYPQENIVIRDFIPFNEIMPHCDAYVTNGGYGGVMLGIQNQLPLVAAGIHEGKNEINARIGYFKLGIDLKTEFPTPEQIRAGVEKVLSDGTYKSNVKKLSREFKDYNPHLLCTQYIDDLLDIKTPELI